MRKEREVPVYLFTGILECGKTSFINVMIYSFDDQDTVDDGLLMSR